MSKTIYKQVIEGSLEYCANGPIGVSSPISKTRLNQGIEGEWGDHSNVFKTILKQGTEGSFGNCANGPMNMGKSYFERGMTTYAKKWKTSEIYKAQVSRGVARRKEAS